MSIPAQPPTAAVNVLDRVRNDGYAVIVLPDPQLTNRVADAAHALNLDNDHVFVSSCLHMDREVAAPVEARLAELVAPTVDELLPGHVAFLLGIVSKGALRGAAVDMHQDLTYTDERQDRALVLWIPLVNHRDGRAAFRVVPRSHIATTAIRPGGIDVLPTAGQQEAMLAASVNLDVPLGSAVLYDAALLHGSPRHDGPSTRPALAVGVVERGVQLVLFVETKDGTLRGAQMEIEDFSTRGLRGPLDDLPAIRPWTRVCGAADFTPPAPPRPRRTSVRRPLLRTGLSRRLRPLPLPGLLLDDGIDLRLRRDGFAWLGRRVPAEAARLVDEATMLLTDDADRRPLGLRPYDDSSQLELDQLVARHLDATVRSLTAHRIIRRGVVRGPSAAPSGQLDRGWTHIDESFGHRSLSVLVGLGPTPARLAVVRHSHRIDASARGTFLRAGWLAHTDVLQRRLLHLNLAAGDVAVLDDATVHAWYDGHTADDIPGGGALPPAVAVIGTAQVDAPLIHLHRVSKDHAACSDVAESFFLHNTPASLRSQPPPAVTRIPIDDPVIWQDQLRHALRTPLSMLDDIMRAIDRLRNSRA